MNNGNENEWDVDMGEENEVIGFGAINPSDSYDAGFPSPQQIPKILQLFSLFVIIDNLANHLSSIERKDTELVGKYLKQFCTELELMLEQHGQIIFTWNITSNLVECMELLGYGAICSGSAQGSLLTYASLMQTLSIIRILAEYGAPIGYDCYGDYTCAPITIAIDCEDIEMTKYFSTILEMKDIRVEALRNTMVVSIHLTVVLLVIAFFN